MTDQQKKLWERLTKEVRDQGMDNLRARELYDELSKLLNMSENKVILSMMETENGIEVHVGEQAYENFAVIGLLERIKLDLLSKPELPIYDLRKKEKGTSKQKKSQNYDA